jgi:hypothetical protein
MADSLRLRVNGKRDRRLDLRGSTLRKLRTSDPELSPSRSSRFFSKSRAKKRGICFLAVSPRIVMNNAATLPKNYLNLFETRCLLQSVERAWSFDLAGCEKTRFMHTTPLKFSIRRRCHNSLRMLKKARLLTRPTLARRDAPCPKQGRSERRGRRTLRYFELLSDARTKPADFFSILLDELGRDSHNTNPNYRRFS